MMASTFDHPFEGKGTQEPEIKYRKSEDRMNFGFPVSAKYRNGQLRLPSGRQLVQQVMPVDRLDQRREIVCETA